MNTNRRDFLKGLGVVTGAAGLISLGVPERKILELKKPALIESASEVKHKPGHGHVSFNVDGAQYEFEGIVTTMHITAPYELGGILRPEFINTQSVYNSEVTMHITGPVTVL